MEPSIYEFPAIFRRVHMERPGDIENEVYFLKQVWQHHQHRLPRRVLDLAAGDSPHGLILARDGIAVVAVDRSATMIAAGRAAARAEHLPLRFYRRSVERFRLPERPFDAAFFMSETFPVITENDGLIGHLQAVGRILRRGALYCVDIDRHESIDRISMRKQWRSREVRIGTVRVGVREFYRPIPWDAAMHSIYELECTIHFPERTVVTRDVIPVRYTTPALMDLAARAAGTFKLVAAYADLSLTRPLAECNGRWLGVLRRL